MAVKEIVNIDIEQLYSHPDNPRKDLGDLAELTESIKKKGIMQNLTVIKGHKLTTEEWNIIAKKYDANPDESLRQKMNMKWSEEGYTILIGHRRCTAAKLADMKEAPCRIVEGLNDREQVAIMLEENMQRNDLTIVEQGQGFQMMLDLGETETSIAEKTGFSKSTIRHRLNIAKLDQKELKKKEADDSFQLSLTDLYELEKIKDVKTRNKILKNARDSRDLIWRVQSAVLEAKREKNKKQIIEMLKKLEVEEAPAKAANELYSGKWEVVKEIELDKDVPSQIKLSKKEQFYYLLNYRSVNIIKKAKKDKVLTPEEEKRRQIDQNKKKIKEIIKGMNIERKEFIKNIISGKIDALKDEAKVKELIWKVLIESSAYISLYSLKKFFTEKNDYECTTEEKNEAQKNVDKLSFLHQMLIVMHCAIENIEICDYQGYFRQNNGDILLHSYEILKLYGWSFLDSKEEEIITGTHELYAVKENEDSVTQ